MWNMFDFAADARNQGGEPGMNHKGLVTFDRKTKKDSFFLYKAYWVTNHLYICVDHAAVTVLRIQRPLKFTQTSRSYPYTITES